MSTKMQSIDAKWWLVNLQLFQYGDTGKRLKNISSIEKSGDLKNMNKLYTNFASLIGNIHLNSRRISIFPVSNTTRKLEHND